MALEALRVLRGLGTPQTLHYEAFTEPQNAAHPRDTRLPIEVVDSQEDDSITSQPPKSGALG